MIEDCCRSFRKKTMDGILSPRFYGNDRGNLASLLDCVGNDRGNCIVGDHFGRKWKVETGSFDHRYIYIRTVKGLETHHVRRIESNVRRLFPFILCAFRP